MAIDSRNGDSTRPVGGVGGGIPPRYTIRRGEPGQMRARAQDMLERRFRADRSLALAFVEAVTGRTSLADMDVRECRDLLDYLDHATDTALVTLARCGNLPRTTEKLEIALALRGDLDSRRYAALIDRIVAVLRDRDTAPPGIAVLGVVVACRGEDSTTKGP